MIKNAPKIQERTSNVDWIWEDAGEEIARFPTREAALQHLRDRGYGKYLDEGYLEPKPVKRRALR